MIRHLIFDCDGVIVDSEVLATRITVDELAQYGYKGTVESHSQRFAGLQEHEIFSRIQREDGIELPEGLVPVLKDIFRVAFQKELKAISGVPNLVKEVQVAKSVVSNSLTDDVIASTTKAGVREHFGERIFSADQVERPKPYPDVYLRAIEMIGLPVDQLLVIEDSLTGATAAMRAGLEVIGFLGASHIFDKKAHRIRMEEIGVQETAENAKDLRKLLASRGII